MLCKNGYLEQRDLENHMKNHKSHKTNLEKKGNTIEEGLVLYAGRNENVKITGEIGRLVQFQSSSQEEPPQLEDIEEGPPTLEDVTDGEDEELVLQQNFLIFGLPP